MTPLTGFEAVAAAAAATLFYTYAGYPLLVAAWSRVAPRPIRASSAYEPTVSVCMAVHDGRAHVTDKMKNLLALEYPGEKIEFLVFSDGSKDGTDEALHAFAAADPRIRVFTSPERLGKPSALNRLRAEARGEVLLLCDVRQPFVSSALRELLLPLSDPRVGCVSGNLVLAGDSGAGLYWRYERLIRSSEARLGSMVGVSGSIYTVRRADMPVLPEDVLLDDLFVPMTVALSRRKRIVLAEAAHAHDTACDDEREFPRKVRTLAGNYQLVAKIPGLLLPGRNPIWFQMTSHKLMRLVCPWALVLLFVASAALSLGDEAEAASPAWRALFAAQLGFYVVAALGDRAGRVGGVARTFVVLNAAAVVGLWRFLRGTQAVTW